MKDVVHLTRAGMLDLFPVTIFQIAVDVSCLMEVEVSAGVSVEPEVWQSPWDG